MQIRHHVGTMVTAPGMNGSQVAKRSKPLKHASRMLGFSRPFQVPRALLQRHCAADQPFRLEDRRHSRRRSYTCLQSLVFSRSS
jgi:hypothetical protein